MDMGISEWRGHLFDVCNIIMCRVVTWLTEYLLQLDMQLISSFYNTPHTISLLIKWFSQLNRPFLLVIWRHREDEKIRTKKLIWQHFITTRILYLFYERQKIVCSCYLHDKAWSWLFCVVTIWQPDTWHLLSVDYVNANTPIISSQTSVSTSAMSGRGNYLLSSNLRLLATVTLMRRMTILYSHCQFSFSSPRESGCQSQQAWIIGEGEGRWWPPNRCEEVQVYKYPAHLQLEQPGIVSVFV